MVIQNKKVRKYLNLQNQDPEVWIMSKAISHTKEETL